MLLCLSRLNLYCLKPLRSLEENSLRYLSMVSGPTNNKSNQKQQQLRQTDRAVSSLAIKSVRSASSLKSLTTPSISTMIKVYPIRALQDNYMYLLVDETTKQAAAVDPVNASAMASAVADFGVDLKCILTTHHHHDHAHGNNDMVSMYPDLTVYGGDQRIQAITKMVNHSEIIRLGSLTIECLSTPCHTSGHICYYVHNEEGPEGNIKSFTNAEQKSTTAKESTTNQPDFPASPPPKQTDTQNLTTVERVVFTGDTLFIAGCGRFFEGSSDQMDQSLNVILGALPNETKVYCGHEYTVSNLKFALSVEPQNVDIKAKLDWAQSQVAKREPTVPSTIGEEKLINPFMRLNKQQVRKFTKEQNHLEVMSILRQKKNEFTVPQ